MLILPSVIKFSLEEEGYVFIEISLIWFWFDVVNNWNSLNSIETLAVVSYLIFVIFGLVLFGDEYKTIPWISLILTSVFSETSIYCPIPFSDIK